MIEFVGKNFELPCMGAVESEEIPSMLSVKIREPRGLVLI
jgi:hypothetical protein